VSTDALTSGQAVADFAVEFVATVGTIVAVMAAYGSWAMDWVLPFLTAVAVAVVCYAAQWGGLFRSETPFRHRVGRSAVRIGLPVGVGGSAVSALDGRGAWLFVFVGITPVALALGAGYWTSVLGE
jgi:hypothetical protein